VTDFVAETRHYCRNPRCRLKLPTPVENPRIEGRTDVAKEVNRAITVLGTPPDKDTARRFMKQVQNSMKYNPKYNPREHDTPPLDAGTMIAWIAILFFGVVGVLVLWAIIAAHP
jgi:hypothetical protein